jgi:fumarate reductase subunit D
MSKHRRSNEPLFWLPFSGGMMLDALLAPALVIATGILVPMGLISPEHLRSLLLHPIIRLILFALIALTFIHAAHRTRFVLFDLGLKGATGLVAAVCYGLALIGIVVAGGVALGMI